MQKKHGHFKYCQRNVHNQVIVGSQKYNKVHVL